MNRPDTSDHIELETNPLAAARVAYTHAITGTEIGEQLLACGLAQVAATISIAESLATIAEVFTSVAVLDGTDGHLA